MTAGENNWSNSSQLFVTHQLAVSHLMVT